MISFSLSDTKKAIKSRKPIVLVNCSGFSLDAFSDDVQFIYDYRWYAVPENFGEFKNMKKYIPSVCWRA